MTDAEAEVLGRELWDERAGLAPGGWAGRGVLLFKVWDGGSALGQGMSWEEAFLAAGVAPEVVGAGLVRAWVERERAEDAAFLAKNGVTRTASKRRPGPRGLAIELIALELGIRKRTLEQWLKRRRTAATARPASPSRAEAPSPPHEG